MAIQKWSFYTHHLQQVSRSFSFCIAQLVNPPRDLIALAYLLFRVVDTIEDSPWDSQAHQFENFDFFEQCLTADVSAVSLANWHHGFDPSIPKAELSLLKDMDKLIHELHALQPKQKEILTTKLSQMIAGMKFFLANHYDQTGLVLTAEHQVNQYCFFVAGLVGELLTEFFADGLDDFKIDDELLINAFHFGLFLQKINILKDQAKDEKLGRKLIPNRAALRSSVELHAIGALSYITKIPTQSGITIRLFCGWSLFIGLASLRWIDKSYELKKPMKISYSETMAVILKVKRSANSTLSLERLFELYLPRNNKIESSLLTNYAISNTEFCQSTRELQLPDWFKCIYPSTTLDKYATMLGLTE